MKNLLLFCFYFCLAASAQAQIFQWAKSQSNDAGSGPVIACGGNIIAATGPFNQTITLGSQTFISADSLNDYLAAYDLSGNVLWAKHVISHSAYPHQVAVDANQNIIITGTFRDSLYIDGLIFKGSVPQSQGIFIVKFNSAGNLIWSRSSGVSANLDAAGTSVSLDYTGDIFLAGTFEDSLRFGNTSYFSNWGAKTYLVKYAQNGNYLWSNSYGSISLQAKVKTFGAGDVYLAYLNNSPIAPEVGIKIHRLNSNGTQIWQNIANIQTAPSSMGFDFEYDLTVDNAANAYLTGNNPRTIHFINQLGGPGSIFSVPDNGNGNRSIFIARISQGGVWKWARQLATGSYDAEAPHILNFNANNELAVSGTISGTANFLPGVPLTTLPQNSWNSFIATLDTAGTIRWTNLVTGSNANFNSGLTIDGNGNLYLAGNFRSGNANFNAHQVSTTAPHENYLAKISNNYNLAIGSIFIDQNRNGIKDTSDPPFKDILLTSTVGNYMTISGADGNYQLALPTGTNTISVINPPRNYLLNPTTKTVTFNGTSQIQNGVDFALQPIPGRDDARVSVNNVTPVRAGMPAQYSLSIHNAGTTTLSDTLHLFYNAGILNFVTASVAPIGNSNGNLTWVYNNLQPNETRNIVATFSVPTAVIPGTPLQAIASINPILNDVYAADNIDTLNLVTVASFDPNNKQVDKPLISPATAAKGATLDYTIRFQNTGTDTAFTVVVTDPILGQLRLPALEMVASSHPYSMKITNLNTLEWHFNNILLPDSATNEPASHGFIRFRMPFYGIGLTDSVVNQALIYFDYNAPVVTNLAVTKVANPTGIKESKTNIQAFKLYPNPAKNYVMVAAEFKKNTPATVSLVNLLGQTLSKVNLPANNQIPYQLPLNALPKGVYLIRLETETGMQTQRLVIQ